MQKFCVCMLIGSINFWLLQHRIFLICTNLNLKLPVPVYQPEIIDFLLHIVAPFTCETINTAVLIGLQMQFLLWYVMSAWLQPLWASHLWKKSSILCGMFSSFQELIPSPPVEKLSVVLGSTKWWRQLIGAVHSQVIIDCLRIFFFFSSACWDVYLFIFRFQE